MEQDVARADFAAVHARLQIPSLRGCRTLDMYALTRQNGHIQLPCTPSVM